MNSRNKSALHELVKHHIESFDYFLDEGLEKALMAIKPITIVDPITGSKLKIFLEKPYLYSPTRNGRLSELIFPTECRQLKSTYRGDFKMDVGFQYDGGVGHLPIILMSKLCHLRGSDPQKLIHQKEEASEVGGCDQLVLWIRLPNNQFEGESWEAEFVSGRERDSILAHGAAYLLHDRLHSCSDYHIADICSNCGSLLTTTVVAPRKRMMKDIKSNLPPPKSANNVTCCSCESSKGMETVAMPYVFRYLAAELAAMSVKLDLHLRNKIRT